MKYFLDCEFIEGFHKPFFGKRRHFIDLISIGIVAEDGREYYAISTEFNSNDADDWVKKNVIQKLPNKIAPYPESSPRERRESLLWRKNKTIAIDILNFVWGADAQPKFYGYYSDYDWVLFCSLFGRMIDLPKGFPMYCMDIKQMMEERGLTNEWKNQVCPDGPDEHNALADAKWNMRLYNEVIKHPIK